MNRRNCLAGGATLAGAAAVSRAGMAAVPEAATMALAGTQAPLQPPNGRPYNAVVTLNGWTLPWRMANGVKEFHLVAEPVVREMAPGMKAHLWGYNGQSPGPTIEVVEGDRARIFVTNKLPEHTTIHWHGQRLPNGMDGVGVLNLPQIPVGKTFVYEFVARRPGTFMYHPHTHQTTAEQVAHDLAAPLIVRAADDPLAHLPEVTMFVTGVRLDANAQVSPNGPMDWALGRQGEMLLVNGGRMPVHTVQPGTTQRWRILNATSARYLRIALEGHALTLVGTDGGLLAAPLAGLSEILVAPAQRVEVLVTADATPSARYRLRALRYQADFMGMGAYRDDDLLTLVTSAEAPAAPASIPSSLRPLTALGAAGATQRIELSEGMGMGMMGGMSAFLINGRSFDMTRVDLTSVQGTIEFWNIVNTTAMDHPFHIHGTQFQLVSREAAGVVTPAPYLAWIDTVNVPSRQSATIRVRQAMPGKRMFHCHILEHEDGGMMGVLEVRPN